MATDSRTLDRRRATSPDDVAPWGTTHRADRLDPDGPDSSGSGRGRGNRVPRTRSELAGLAALLVGTAVAYMWNLSASGYANSFYAAAVQAGTKSWKAFFFGSLDSSNFITVDKPPASLWVMELSGRIFGFSSLSMLIPEALEGVATVALLYAIIRRWYGHRIGLIAGVVMATTPVAALMFRFNNPDALLVLLLTAGAYCMTRAIERASTRWLVLAGTAVGFAFLTKMGQALLVVPAFGLAYLIAAPTGLGRRVLQLLAGLAALIVSAGWFVLIVTLWPVGSRPMIDGSPTNSLWNLIVEYNGLDRVVSSNSSGPGGGGGGGGFSGSTGLFRLFNSLMGGQASWLIPMAAMVLVGGLILRARAPRTDHARASLIIWGGWLAVTGLTFSYGQGIIHTYYTVALAPAIAALVAIGVALVAERWDQLWTRFAAAGAVAVTAWWAVELLDRSPDWNPWLRPLIVAAAALAAVGLVASALIRQAGVRHTVAAAALSCAIVASLGGPAAYALQTVRTAQTGSIPSAGPTTTSAFGGGGGGGGGGGLGGPGAARSGGSAGPGGSGAGGPGGSGAGGSGGGPGGAGGFGGASGPPSGTGQSSSLGTPSSGTRPSGAGTGGSFGGGAGGGTAVSATLVSALKNDASDYRWVAATDGSQSAATLELATGGEPVMAIGGFNNQGGNLSLAQFEKYVAAGDIHYYIASGSGGGPGGGGSQSSSITSWVESHFTAQTIGSETVYNLTSMTKA